MSKGRLSLSYSQKKAFFFSPFVACLKSAGKTIDDQIIEAKVQLPVFPSCTQSATAIKKNQSVLLPFEV